MLKQPGFEFLTALVALSDTKRQNTNLPTLN